MECSQTKERDPGAVEEMNFDRARLFVRRMKESAAFRSSVAGFKSSAEMWDFLRQNGFEFGACDLVRAMAACMAEMGEAS